VQSDQRRPGKDPERNTWRRRPNASRALRVAVFIVPIAASFLIAVLLNQVLPHGHGALIAILWIGVIACGSLFTLVVFERAARRLLPLAALLNVSLVFPDKAPARFAVARKTGNPRQLREQLADARAAGQRDDAQGMQTVLELVLALSVHDKATRGHSERVRVFADMIAHELKIDESGQARLRWAALLHDVGKLEIAPALLNKPGKPNEEEWKVLHRHPEHGARLVAPLLPWLGEWGRAVVEHHERWDGTGYPHRLKGTEISLAARIVAVADVYEVMTSPRPYKRSVSVAAAREELTRVAGTQLDPGIVRAFLNISIGRLWRTVGFGAWIGQIPNIGRLWAEFGSVGSWAGSGALSAVTATVLTVGGFGGAPPAFHQPSPGLLAPFVASSTGHNSPSPSDAPGGHATPTSQPTSAGSASTPSPKPGVKLPPMPTPTVQPTATPAPTPKPTPNPTPNPGLCPTCTNPSPTCVTGCLNNNLPKCTSYCEGNNNSQCLNHCYGPNTNPQCLQYCVGASNPKCVHDCVGPNNPKCVTNCRLSGALAATAAVPSRRLPTVTALLSTRVRYAGV
jgi:HD domain